MMKKIVTIGGATRDIFILYERAQMMDLSLFEGQRSFLILEDGKKVEMSGRTYHTGGGAANTAIGIGRLGHIAATFFKVGQDQEGTYIMQSVATNGVDVTTVIATAQAPTAQSFIVPTQSGQRVSLVYRGANATIQEEEIPVNLLKSAHHIHCSSLSGESARRLLFIGRLAREYGITVSANPGSSQLAEHSDDLCSAMQYLDLLIVNADEACCCMAAMARADNMVSHRLLAAKKIAPNTTLPRLLQATIVRQGLCFGLHSFFDEAHARGIGIVIVTNGDDGVYVSTKDILYYHPSLVVPVISTLGAGDAFVAGFIAMHEHGYSIADAIRAGMLNSASVIGHIGATTGLLKKDEIERQLKTIVKTLLREYDRQKMFAYL